MHSFVEESIEIYEMNTWQRQFWKSHFYKICWFLTAHWLHGNTRHAKFTHVISIFSDCSCNVTWSDVMIVMLLINKLNLKLWKKVFDKWQVDMWHAICENSTKRKIKNIMWTSIERHFVRRNRNAFYLAVAGEHIPHLFIGYPRRHRVKSLK